MAPQAPADRRASTCSGVTPLATQTGAPGTAIATSFKSARGVACPVALPVTRRASAPPPVPEVLSLGVCRYPRWGDRMLHQHIGQDGHTRRHASQGVPAAEGFVGTPIQPTLIREHGAYMYVHPDE